MIFKIAELDAWEFPTIAQGVQFLRGVQWLQETGKWTFQPVYHENPNQRHEFCLTEVDGLYIIKREYLELRDGRWYVTGCDLITDNAHFDIFHRGA